MIDGKMQDDATYKQCQVMVEATRRSDRAPRRPTTPSACGFSADELAGD